jgi:hypothetical protein
MDDAFDHRLLGEVAGHVERLAQTTPSGDLPAALRPIVRRTLVAVRPDGTWPEAALLQEDLRASLPSPGPRWADTRPGRQREGRGQPCTPPSTVKD